MGFQLKRMTTVRGADRIFVLDDGVSVESGTQAGGEYSAAS